MADSKKANPYDELVVSLAQDAATASASIDLSQLAVGVELSKIQEAMVGATTAGDALGILASQAADGAGIDWRGVQAFTSLSYAPHAPTAIDIMREARGSLSLNGPALTKKVNGLLKKKRLRHQVDRSTIFRILRGTTSRPNPRTVTALAEVLNLTPEQVRIVRTHFRIL